MKKQYSKSGITTIKPFRWRPSITHSVVSLMPFREKFYYKVKETITNKIVLKGEADTHRKALDMINEFMNRAI